MSKESHRQYLERQALREAQKGIDRRGRNGFGVNDFGGLRIQTLEPWKRVLLGSVGLLFGGLGVDALYDGAGRAALVPLVLAASGLLISLFGGKRTIDAALLGTLLGVLRRIL